MKTLQILRKTFRPSPARFDRYYTAVIRQGTGYPTADEARRDMRAREQAANPTFGWMR